MAVVFYDNLESTPVDDFPGFIEVERLYCFAWDRFTETHWKELARIYGTLPGFIGDPHMPEGRRRNNCRKLNAEGWTIPQISVNSQHHKK